MESSDKVMEKIFRETTNEETIVIEDSDSETENVQNDEILQSQGFHDNQEFGENLNANGPVIMDCISNVDINFKDQTVLANCSRKMNKQTTKVQQDTAKTNIDLKEQINEAKSSSTSDEIVIDEDRHMKEHDYVIQDKLIENQRDERPFKCDACDKSYSLLRTLKAHNKRCHKKEKPYQCNYCEQQFTTIRNLDKHIVIHSSTQPYRCGFCPKSFTEMNHLAYHLKLHNASYVNNW